MKDREKSFVKTLFTIFFIGIVLEIGILFIFLFIKGEREYENKLKEYKNFVIYQKKLYIKDFINHLISYIEYEKKTYKDEVDEKTLQDRLLKYFSSLRYGNGNYLIILKKDGTMLMHPFRKQEIGKNVLNIQDPTGKYITKELLKAAEKPDGGYIEYVWEKPGTKRYVPKIGYAKLYKPWGWILTTGIYMDDIENFVKQQKKEFKNGIRKNLFAISILLSLLFLAGLFALLWLTDRLKKNIDILIRFFNKASTLHEKITLNNIKFLEFRELARYANKMIDDIKKEERKATAILDAIPDFMFILDKEGKILDWRGPRELLYLPPEKFLGKNIKELFPGELGNKVCDAIDKVLEDGKRRNINYTIVVKGDRHYFEGRVIKIEEDKVLIIERDFTEKVRMEKELEMEKTQLLVTLKSIGDGVIVTDSKGIISLMNNMAEELTGWKEEEAKGRPINEVFSLPEGKESVVQEVIAQKRAITLPEKVKLITKDEKEILISDSASPIIDKNGNVLGVIIVFRDVTEREKIQRELMKINKLETIGTLTGGIAHDFNNYMTSLRGIVDTIYYKKDMDREELEKKLDMMESILKKATDITKQLLSLSKGGATEKRIISPSKLVRETTLFNLQGSNVEPVFEIPDDLWDVEVDEGQFSRAIQNIIINAKEAMPQGGRIFVSMRNVSIKGDPIIKDGDYVEIVIKDEGGGIPKDILPNIFDPFFTTKKKGNGLGLSVTHSVIQKHNGSIRVESEEGIGTIFYILIPGTKKKAKEKRKTERKEDGYKMEKEKKAKILLMDDDPFIREVVAEQLNFLGYEVGLAKDGEEAIRIYKESKEKGTPFDLIIMDLTIKGGMGGKEAAEKIREFDKDVPIVVSTGYSDGDIVADYENYGFSGVLTKPFKMEKLKEVLKELLGD